MKPATIEMLEDRIAPAAVFFYTEPDGDQIQVKTSVGNSAGLFLSAKFSAGSGPKLLQKLDLTTFASEFAGADVTISVLKRGAAGDGLAAVGAIKATNMDLGKVTVQGDLGQIDAGNAALNGPAVKSLKVHSMGAFGLTTQGAADPDRGLDSTLVGKVPSLTVTTDLLGVQIGTGGLGKVKIGGSILEASLGTSDGLQSLTLRGNVTGSIVASAGNIGSIVVKGSLLGTVNTLSGVVIAQNGNIGSVKIGRDIIAGTGEVTTQASIVTGTVSASGRIGTVTVGGDIVANSIPDNGGVFSGTVLTGISAGLDLGAVKIGGNVIGNSAHDVLITGYTNPDPANHVAIKSVSIAGYATHAAIGAGYGVGSRVIGQTTGNADAQIGRITVGGNWTDSVAAAGAAIGGVYGADGDDMAMSGGDANIASRIGAIVIKGRVLGVESGGFEAQEIGSLSINGGKIALKTASAGPDRFAVGNSGKVFVYEL